MKNPGDRLKILDNVDVCLMTYLILACYSMMMDSDRQEIQ